MLLAISYLYVFPVKLQRRIVFPIAFIEEANFYSLITWIRFERYFPLENPFTYFSDVRFELRVWSILSIKEVSSAKIFKLMLIRLVDLFSGIFLCCTLFELRFFRVALFSILLKVSLISCCALFMFHSFQVALFCVLHFSCCTFSVLQFFNFALFSNWFFFRVALISYSTFFVLHPFSYCTFCTLISCCTFSMLQFFHVELFSWCTFSVL